ncbi:MAG: ribonuclease P protein component 1 [Methanosarcinales archaeon]|nr:ribonuclease P protein component 1 [Methanosarcinales archaeon]
MQLTPQNLIHHELIGLEVAVVDSTNTAQIGIKGTVIDETRNTIHIDVGDRHVKTVPKSHTQFMFTIPAVNGRRYLPETSAWVKVDGTLLLSQPENRIQTKFKKTIRRRVNL